MKTKRKSMYPVKRVCAYCNHDYKSYTTSQQFCSRRCANRRKHSRVSKEANIEQAVVEELQACRPEKHQPWGTDMFGSLVALSVWLESVSRDLKDMHERLSALEARGVADIKPDALEPVRAVVAAVHEDYKVQASLMCNVLMRLNYLETEFNIQPPATVKR